MLQPGSAAQLFGDRTGCLDSTVLNLSFMHLVNIFLMDLSNIIGLVILMLFSQSLDFGIGYMVPLLHLIGVLPQVRILLKS